MITPGVTTVRDPLTGEGRLEHVTNPDLTVPDARTDALTPLRETIRHRAALRFE